MKQSFESITLNPFVHFSLWLSFTKERVFRSNSEKLLKRLKHYGFISSDWYGSGSSVTYRFYEFHGWWRNRWQDRIFHFVTGMISGVVVGIAVGFGLHYLLA